MLYFHPCVILSPVWYLITRVLSYHPCVLISPVFYLITRVISHLPYAILSPMCYLITRVLSYHPCALLSPVCYLITRVIRCTVALPACFFSVFRPAKRTREKGQGQGLVVFTLVGGG